MERSQDQSSKGHSRRNFMHAGLLATVATSNLADWRFGESDVEAQVSPGAQRVPDFTGPGAIR
jgi:hypothetical protein